MRCPTAHLEIEIKQYEYNGYSSTYMVIHKVTTDAGPATMDKQNMQSTGQQIRSLRCMGLGASIR